MSSPRLEAFLASIYLDEQARAKFLADPRGATTRAGLAESEIAALEKIDRVGLELTARSLSRKRQRGSKKGSTRVKGI
jgi:hypothetical protein